MKTKHTLLLALVLGVVIGILGVSAIRAQQVKVSPAYIIAEVEVTDPAMFQKYAENVPGTLASFNGQYLVRGGKIQGLEGETPKRFVVISFDSMEKAQSWYDSPAYAPFKPIRHSAAKSRLFIVEGVSPK